MSQQTKDEQRRFFLSLLNSAEGRVFIIGIALAIAYLLWLSFGILFFPREYQHLAGMSITHIFLGRAAGMSYAFTMDQSNRLIIITSMLIETIMVLLFYPLFVFSIRRLLVFPFLRKHIDRIVHAAQNNHNTVRRYGILGLFVFVWFPFWLTGPLVGCVIGFFLGLKILTTLCIVLGGTYVAILCWAVLLQGLHEKLMAFSPYAPLLFLFLLIVIIIIGNWLHRKNRNMHT